MDLSKIAEYPKIRAVHLRNKHERQIFTVASFDLPGTENAAAVGVDDVKVSCCTSLDNKKPANPYGLQVTGLR
jgi:hypothetical protein